MGLRTKPPSTGAVSAFVAIQAFGSACTERTVEKRAILPPHTLLSVFQKAEYPDRSAIHGLHPPLPVDPVRHRRRDVLFPLPVAHQLRILVSMCDPSKSANRRDRT